MKVLVTGAAGFLGRNVVDALLRRGHSVRAIVRPASEDFLPSENLEIFAADLRVHDNLISALTDINTVLHLAAATSGNEDLQFASTVMGTERFLEAMARSPVRRLIHVSSLVVYDWARVNGTMDENSPTLKDPYSMGGYAIAKVWQERLVRRFANINSWELTVIRPGFIWGRDHAKIAGMGRQFGRAYVMFGPFTHLPLCHVVNCADCLVATVEKPEAIGQTFNLIDNGEIRVWRYMREYARGTGKQGLMVPVPYYLAYAVAVVASLTNRTLFGNKGRLPSLLTPWQFASQFKPIRFSNRKLKEILGWQPIITFDQSLRLTYVKRDVGDRTTQLLIR